MNNAERDELLDMIVDVVRQACTTDVPFDHEGFWCCTFCNGTYEDAFALLEKHGRLKWRDERHYWARLYTTEEVRP